MIYPVPRTAAQLWHVEGAPMGTRGGISVVHVFPADGEYRFRMMMHSIPTGQLYGSTTRGEQIEVSVNGDAQGADRHQPAHERVGSEGHQHRDRADLDQGRPAAHLGRVPRARGELRSTI